MSQQLSVLLPGDFSDSVLLEQDDHVTAVTHDIVSLFCVENNDTEAASCLAFSWVFQNEILMEIR